METKDFSFQGKVYLGTRLAGGKPGVLRWVGDSPKCEVALSTESETRRESYSGKRLPSARLQKGSDAKVSMTLNWANADNLALGLYGKIITVAGGSVTAEVLPTGLVAGDVIALDRGGVSTLVITDSTASPVTATEGTHYALESANGGIVRIIDPASLVQPLKAAYQHTASRDVSMFTGKPPERYLLLDGINTLDNSPVKMRLYRLQFDPFSSIPLINEGFGTLELEGAALYDDEAALDDDFGGFGKIEQSTAVA
ncbi:hypothetical protein ABE493_07870 [Stenotrophomonas terrae]|uniref:phage tail tube protein n=1 Tax=Stenotrophomonas terrae TaxID=405446 RepID=UPI00320AE526